MNDEFEIDKRRVRASFSRAADTYDAAAVLQQEVVNRMLERLDYIKIAPQRILDVGCGTGFGALPLAKRYAGARVAALDLSERMLHALRGKQSRWERLPLLGRNRIDLLCADMESLPVASGSVDVVWSNAALQWCNTPDAAFAEMRRVLRPGGLLMFSTFGPDTLKELRAAFGRVDGHTHVSRFIDMHDIGDALVRAGFQTPVMDVEHVTLTYDDARGVMRDLKAIGAGNATAGRGRGLAGPRRMARMAAEYETFRRDGRLPATYEVVYGHAWVPAVAEADPDGPRPVTLHPRRREGVS